MAVGDLDALVECCLSGVEGARGNKATSVADSARSSPAQDWARKAVSDLLSTSAPAERCLVQDDALWKAAQPRALPTPSRPEPVGQTAVASSSTVPAPHSSSATVSSGSTFPAHGRSMDSADMMASVKALQGWADTMDPVSPQLAKAMQEDFVAPRVKMTIEAVEKYLKDHPQLASAEKSRCEAYIKTHQRILEIFTSSGDCMSDSAMEEVMRQVLQIESMGELPEEIQRATGLQESEGPLLLDLFRGFDPSGDGSIEEQLMEKMQDPAEMDKVVKDLGQLADNEACKQQ